MSKQDYAYYGSKRSKVVHSKSKGDQCRVAEIAPHNRVYYKDGAEVLAKGKRTCAICCPVRVDG